ncbi:TonB-dependent receptor [Sphingobacterium alkalisoli]|uniref:TonB-dependent receptor n=1 Tax=Sphingobacterium alkalisoli TaxID=1874115 RepID=A0A4U0GS64_9SPHI|nr:outer membrane beta-barrel protein [Sphingobacterium alkalisoli]TJY61294.1 TonB-dependent receptor [Sphingobacterium alkalisoli]GGH31153.1 collagen-binding protein [Sphingobacterium alkalisoli]
MKRKSNNMSRFLKSLILILLLTCAGSIQAQTGKTVQGMLRDSLSRIVAGASVLLVSDQDSLGTSSSQAGIYTFNNVKGNQFKIRIASLGFEAFEREFTFPVGEQKMIIPSFELKGIPNMLEEVIVSGVLTVQVKGDTVEYGTKDLKLREGSVAEDALKKLQGVEVDKDGNVTAQGEAITRVRINGKDFFGGDVKTATQNLPANIIEKIQVVDDYGDMANLTGNKSGESTKVLNIQIDPQYNNGVATTLRVGAGTEERYQATGMVMGFRDKTQVSFLGNLNNMNANLFDFNSMGGGARGRQGGGGRGGSGMFGGSEGITNTGSVGLNIRHDFSDKLKLYGSYSFGRDDNNTLSNSFTEYIGQSLTEESDQDNNSIRANHRFEGNLEWNISDNDYVKFTPQIGFNKNTTDNLANSTFYDESVLDNIQNQTSISDVNSPRYNFSGLYNRKLNDKGRNLFFNFNYDNAVTDNEYNQILERLVYDPSNQDVPVNEIFEQTLRESQNKSWNAGTSISYTEPFSERAKLEVTYDYNINDYDNYNRQRAQDENGDPLSSTLLNYSYDYDYAFTTHRVGASYMYDNDKIKYSLGASVQPSQLKGDAFSATESAVIDRANFNIIPIARFEYKFSKQSNLTLNYSGRSSEPGVSQILPFEVSTNRTNITIGNPELDPEFRHSMNLRFRSGDFQKGKTFFAILRTELTQDKIVSMNRRYTVDGDGLYQEVGYQNESSPVYSIGSFYHWGRSLKEKTYNIMYGGGVNFNRNISYLTQSATADDFAKGVTNNTTINQMLFFRYNPSENLEINPGLRYAYNITSSSLPDFASPNTRKITPSLIGSVNITPTTIFGADVSKEFNKGYRTDANPFIINTYIEQRFMKGQRGTLRLQGFDLLNQQTNIDRSVGDILTDSRTNRLARYFMLTFTFKLQKFSGMAPDSGNSFPGGMRRPRM